MDNETKWLVLLSIILICSSLVSVIALIGGYIWIQHLDNTDAKITTTMVSYSLNTTNRISKLENASAISFSKQDERLRQVEDKLYEISLKEAALQAEIASKNETEQVNLTSFNSSIQRMQMQLAFQYAILLKLNNTMIENITDIIQEIPNELLPYQNLSCYADLKEAFCVNDWCRANLNPEWICSASQQLPEYAQWNTQACGCARQAGVNV